MKKCKACQKEIDPKARKCPYCQADQRNWFAKHKILTGFLVLIVLIIILSIAGNGKSKPATTAANTPVPTAQPAINVSAVQLASDYHANEVSADEKYKGNTLIVTGTVDSINEDFLNDPYIQLSDGLDDDGITDVDCHFSQSDVGSLAKLSKGQKVTVQATDNGMVLGSVNLQSCTLQ